MVMAASDTRIWGDDKRRTCCICGERFTGMGNNPEPLGGEDPEARCCDDCNVSKVIPARLKALSYFKRK
jgi:hypothetical protein